MVNNKSSHAAQNRLDASLLSLDKPIYRFVAKKNEVMDYVRFTLVQTSGAKGFLDTTELSESADSRVISKHASELQADSPDYVLVRVNLLTYGQGTLQHPYFANRKRYTEANTVFTLAIRELDAKKVHMVKIAKGVCTRQSQEIVDSTLAPFGKTSDELHKLIEKLSAAQNEISNGTLKPSMYDARESIRAGKLTSYGLFLKDSGRSDKAMRDFAKTQIVLEVTPNIEKMIDEKTA